MSMTVDNLISRQPLVTIVMPCFNHERFVAEAIDSVLAQTYLNIEVIIVDDGSTDDTLAIVRKYGAERSSVTIISQQNRGISAALNAGLSRARGEFVAFIASDDVMLPDKTMEHVTFLTGHPEYAVVAGEYRRIDENGGLLDALGVKASHSGEISLDVLDGCVFHPLTATYRLSALKEVGLFKVGIKNEDWYIQIMLKKFGFRFYFIPNFVGKYRIHGDNDHLQIERAMSSKRALATCFRGYERQKIIRSAYRHSMALTMQHFGLRSLLSFAYRHFGHLIHSGAVSYLPRLVVVAFLRQLKIPVPRVIKKFWIS